MQKYFLLLFLIGFAFILSACGKRSSSSSEIKQQIICFGDSLTKGYGASDGKGYPYYLQQKVNCPVINLGINGNTSADGLRRINEVLKHINSLKTTVIIEFGANDFFRQVPLRQTRKNMENIIDKLISAGAHVVVVSPQDIEMNDIYILLKDVSEKKNVVFIDGILNEIWNRRELFSDSVHPNSQGYKLVAEKIYNNLKIPR